MIAFQTCTNKAHLDCEQCKVDRLLHRLKSRMKELSLDELQHEMLCRLTRLKASPEELNQNEFRVCGATAVIYLLLNNTNYHDFVTRLFLAVMGGLLFPQEAMIQFETPKKVAIQFELAKFANQFTKNAQSQAPFLVDFILARGLGEALKKVNPSVYKTNKTNFDVKYWGMESHKTGSLALNTAALMAILQEVVGLKAKIIELDKSDPVSALVQLSQKFGKDRMAIAGVWSEPFNPAFGSNPKAEYLSLLEPIQDTTSTPKAKIESGMPYNHWVVLNGKMKLNKDDTIEVPLWSWGASKTFMFSKKSLTTYIKEVIVVKS